MLKNTYILSLCMLVALACDTTKPPPKEPAQPVPPPSKLAGMTAQKKFFVEVSPTPTPIPFQQLFALDVQISGADKQPLEGASIDDVRAIMPAHNHGMNVKPEVTAQGGGKFRVEGMRFHMRGDGDDGLWVLELVINHQGTIDQTAFEVQCCTTP
jgi:hypothetical protein